MAKTAGEIAYLVARDAWIREAAIKALQIRWPSGAVQQLSSVHIDRVLEVEEPR